MLLWPSLSMKRRSWTTIQQHSGAPRQRKSHGEHIHPAKGPTKEPTRCICNQRTRTSSRVMHAQSMPSMREKTLTTQAPTKSASPSQPSSALSCLHHVLEGVESLRRGVGVQWVHRVEQHVRDLPWHNLRKGIVDVHDLTCRHRRNDLAERCVHSRITH